MAQWAGKSIRKAILSMPQIIGAEDDGDEDKDGDATKDGSGEGGSGKDDDDDDDSGDGQRDVVSRKEFDSIKERMRLADRNKSDAEKQLKDALARIKDFEDKDKTELDKAKGDADEAVKENERLTKQLEQLRVQMAFFSNNKYAWHNPGAALKLVDLTDVSIGDDGEITGMDKAIKKLAEDNPYLIKKEDEEQGPKKSGTSNNGGGKGSGKPDRSKLEKQFPALRGR